MLFLSLPVCLNAQEAVTEEPIPKKDSTGNNFYWPVYYTDPMSFFMSEYQNALANEKKANWYLTVLWRSGEGPGMFAFSTGFILPVWRNDKGDSWSLIGHGSIVSGWETHVAETMNGFGGGGIRADYGIVSLGFLGGGYHNNYKSNYKYKFTHVSADGTESGIWTPQTVEEEDLFKFTVPISFGLSKQTVFIDRLIGNFGFSKDFDLTQLFSELAFTPLRLGAMRLGINVYYKNEDYNVIAKQQLIGASFTAKYLQFDGGYRFFTMKQNSEGVSYDDGPYGRMIVKIPFSLFGTRSALAFSIALDDLDQKSDVNLSFGIGFSFLSSRIQVLDEFGSENLAYLLHFNLRANEH
ncbi:MAG: hypothetical protein Ta2B_14550 [Termitinemataceae bacterium]|nr:MAG: hypothetical protein Ta2B_14550 [Termitinemataceae bacterium]